MLFFATRCANEVTPSGGPRDETPPKLLSSEPAMGSTNFNEKIIKVNFDEYLQLKKLNEQMVISPPMKEKPEVILRGKTLVIKIKDTLREATTYNLFLGDAVADLNEANIYPGFRYVFSTGDYIDSLSVKGTVIDAVSGDPVEEAWVIMYPAGPDSLFFTSTPYYIANTDENGAFELSQLRDTIYRIYAIKDINSNYYFDLPSEQIAFIDSLIQPGYISRRPDSIPDTIPFTPLNTVPQLTLNLYEEPDTVLKIMSSDLVDDYVVDFVFNNPAKEVHFVSADTLPLPEHISRISEFGDTIRWWIADTSYKVLKVAAIYDTLVLDTLRIPTVITEKKAGPPRSLFSGNLKSGSRLKPETAFTIISDHPIAEISDRQSTVKSISDSSMAAFEFDDEYKRHLKLNYTFLEDSSYSLLIPDSSFFDIYGNTNDTLVYRVSVAGKKEYGSLEFTLTLPETIENTVLYLNDSRDKVLAKRQIKGSATVTFPLLELGEYSISLLLDEDGNGRWSSGMILKNRQPEQVIKFGKEVEIRANWVVQESWEL